MDWLRYAPTGKGRALGAVFVAAALVAGGCSCSDDSMMGVDGSLPDGGPALDAPMGDAPSPTGCGNGDLDPGEMCDDGNTTGGDGCSADCLSDETCGNAVTDEVAGEVCDDGNTTSGDGCSADCASDETCGNEVTDLAVGEVCDDGNMTGGDGCSADCESDETCGNEIVDRDAGEQCDDGNTAADDGCDAACQLENCGDGVLDAPLEQCDDGNDVDGDGCDIDCTYTCEVDADCAAAMCTTGTCDTDTNMCVDPVSADDGTACDRDSDPETRDICLDGSCQSSICGDGFQDAPEACDDGNDVDGDGCDTDCTFSCRADVDCDDGAICNGAETCDRDTHTCQDAPDAEDGTSCDAERVCRAGSCAPVTCGDGTVDGPVEDCDDMNTDDGDGCDNDCTYSCTGDADCDDGRLCNGTETCNTTDHVCEASEPPAAGTECDRDMGATTRDICVDETCQRSVCGDEIVDTAASPAEECDDGNAELGDGCENDCTFTCTENSDCDDGDSCNGVETCNTADNVCVPGTSEPDGTECDADGMAGTRDICVDESCGPSVCGDDYVDTGATPAEECDDGNMTGGDGCEADCTLGATAYRITSLEIVDPHLFLGFGTTCSPATDFANTTFQAEITGDQRDNSTGADGSDGYYDLSIVTLFQPLDRTMTTNPVALNFDAFCSTADDTCGPSSSPMSIAGIANIVSTAGTYCFEVTDDILATLTDSYHTFDMMGDYLEPLNEPQAVCFATIEDTFVVSLSGVPITLRNAHMAARFENPAMGETVPPGLAQGVIAGFLTEEDARNAIIPNDIIGDTALYSLLLDADEETGEPKPGSACESSPPEARGDDSDSLDVDGDGMPENGFWFYLNFEANLVDWVETSP